VSIQYISTSPGALTVSPFMLTSQKPHKLFEVLTCAFLIGEHKQFALF